ncbi:MAG: 2-dehydropantoate 2-reductase N-terminal domain-containing protein, partial [Pseudomonadota bacterium]
MKIAVIGAGGVGGYFGGRLAAAGHQVFFAVRGRQREAFREQGLRLKSALGDLTLPDPLLLDNPETIGVCDAVLICTKLWGLEEALELVRPLVGDDTMVVPLQNGVDAESLAVERLGTGAVLGGVAYIAAEIEEPGVIRHTGKMARLALGELDGRESPRLKALVAACQAAQVDVKLSTHIQ